MASDSLPVVRRRRSVWSTTSQLVGEQGGERVGVAGGDRGVDAGRVRGRGVRSHAALAPGGSGRRGRRRLGRQLVEARERLGVALGVELLDRASARPSAPKTQS